MKKVTIWLKLIVMQHHWLLVCSSYQPLWYSLILSSDCLNNHGLIHICPFCCWKCFHLTIAIWILHTIYRGVKWFILCLRRLNVNKLRTAIVKGLNRAHTSNVVWICHKLTANFLCVVNDILWFMLRLHLVSSLRSYRTEANILVVRIACVIVHIMRHAKATFFVC